MKSVTTKYDKRKEYDAQIAEKVSELKRLCNKAKIPMFFAACVKNDRDSEYEIELLSPAVCDVSLKKDWFCRFVNVTCGFDTVVPNYNIPVDADDIFAANEEVDD